MSNEVRIKATVTGNAKNEIGGLRDAWRKFQQEGSVGVKAGLTAAVAAKGFSILDSAISGGVGVMQDAVAKASDLNETMSKSGVVFGQNADEVSKWGDTAAEAMGLSKQAAIESAASFGDLFNKVGIGAEKSQAMATELVGLSADLASFNNLAGGSAEALEKIRSGLSGETEPLRSLGVFLNEAKVKAKAMELGLADAHGELTEGAKIQARYALILEETASAQGDFARTSDGLANKQRINQAKLDDALANFGNVILPIVSSAAGDASRALDGLAAVVDLLNGKVPQSEEGLDALGRQINSLNPLVIMSQAALDNMTEAQEDATRAAEQARETQLRLQESTEETTARLIESGEAAAGVSDEWDGTAGAARTLGIDVLGLGQALLDTTGEIADNARETRDARDAAKDLERALNDLIDAAEDTTRAFGDQKFSATELAGRMSELEQEIIDSKEELRELKAIKDPTAEQRRDIAATRGDIAGMEHDLFNTRVELALLNGTGLDALYKELSGAQYRTDALGDSARAALRAFQLISFAEKKVTGFRGDPGFGRAEGGPVQAGQMYLVGEKGPELFVPKGAGDIVPNHALTMTTGGGGDPVGGAPSGATFNFYSVFPATPAAQQAFLDAVTPSLARVFARKS